MKSIEEKREKFRELHQSGCFAIPNPWDIGTAKYLQHLGFKAVATTSAGFAFSRGLADGSVKRDEMITHIRELVDAIDIPVNADFEDGFGPDPNGVFESVQLAIATGIAGSGRVPTTGYTCWTSSSLHRRLNGSSLDSPRSLMH